jgi:hypothetical protein
MREETIYQSFEVVAYPFESGLVGTIGVRVDQSGANIVARTTAGIIEFPAGSGIYKADITVGQVGVVEVVWDNGNAVLEPGDYAVEEIEIVAQDLAPTPVVVSGGQVCNAWVSSDAVLDCCDSAAAALGSDTQPMDQYALAATEILWMASGRQFAAGCEVTVRPCEPDCGCGLQRLPQGTLIGWEGYEWVGRDCGRIRDCCHMSRVLLSGYPVREISQVKIDGVPLDASEYRLDEARWLTRLADGDGDRQYWPGCQRMDLPDTEAGTFAVTYTYGADPPALGVLAASELACELWSACSDGECRLPAGVTQTVRQGVTHTMGLVAEFITSGKTGLTLVDSFIAAYGQQHRRPAVWIPGRHGYARPVG